MFAQSIYLCTKNSRFRRMAVPSSWPRRVPSSSPGMRQVSLVFFVLDILSPRNRDVKAKEEGSAYVTLCGMLLPDSHLRDTSRGRNWGPVHRMTRLMG